MLRISSTVWATIEICWNKWKNAEKIVLHKDIKATSINRNPELFSINQSPAQGAISYLSKTHGLAAMQPAVSSAGKPQSPVLSPVCSWLAEKKTTRNKQHSLRSQLHTRSFKPVIFFLSIRLNAMRKLVAKLNDVIYSIVVSKQLIQRKNVGPLPKWLSMVAGLQEVSHYRPNISFVPSFLYLHNIYLSSPLPAFNNIARSQQRVNWRGVRTRNPYGVFGSL